MHKQFGYCRVGAAVPLVRPGAVSSNIASMTALARKAADAGADILVFPELCVTGYTCADLFFQSALLDAAEKGFELFLKKIWQCDTLFVVGMPLRADNLLFNCAVACRQGNVLGAVPKTFLPNTREFYEKRWFSAAGMSQARSIQIGDEDVPFGTDLIFKSLGIRECAVGIEICEDLWSPAPPSTRLALNGATILCNPSASNELAGKSAYRRDLVRQQSARCLAAYVYAGAGPGESSTDLVFGGHALIAENGALLAENRRFTREPDLLLADVDVGYLAFERRQSCAYAQCAAAAGSARRIVYDAADETAACHGLLRTVNRQPFVPADAAERGSRCAEIFAVQSTGLATRLIHTGRAKVVVGVSGGLDSALALLVTCEAFAQSGLDRAGINAMTLPGFGTTCQTRQNAERLCAGLGVELETIDIAAASRQHLSDIGHAGERLDAAYENAQARERTQVLMDKANMLNALVVGTGDLSELALGWCTYNGDHMSMYGVNSGVPKTLVCHIVNWFADQRADPLTAAALRAILATPVSPELLPADSDGRIAQKTEDTLGPYELHDFILYHFVRRGAPFDKIRFLANIAFAGVYPEEQIDNCLQLFKQRFFSQQFKRSCLPDGPKVGTVNLSPRGDWRMPSDLCGARFNPVESAPELEVWN